MPGELAIAQGIQTLIQAMAEFADADVVINDWSVLDSPNPNAPYVILATADEFESKMDSAADQTKWSIPVALYEYFTDWPNTLNNFRTRRQAIIDLFNSAASNARSAGGLDAVQVNVIRSEGPIMPYYAPYTPSHQIPEALPVYLHQTWIFEVEEW